MENDMEAEVKRERSVRGRGKKTEYTEKWK